MNGIGIAEEIVHITQNLLISSHEEHAYIIVLTIADSVERQIGLLMAVVNVSAHFFHLSRR